MSDGALKDPTTVRADSNPKACTSGGAPLLYFRAKWNAERYTWLTRLCQRWLDVSSGVPRTVYSATSATKKVMPSFGNTLPIVRKRKSQIFLNSKLEVCVMPILLDQMRPIAFFSVFRVASFNAAAAGPVGAVGAPKRTVLVFYGHPQSLPANRMIEQGLTTALSSAHAGPGSFLGIP